MGREDRLRVDVDYLIDPNMDMHEERDIDHAIVQVRTFTAGPLYIIVHLWL